MTRDFKPVSIVGCLRSVHEVEIGRDAVQFHNSYNSVADKTFQVPKVFWGHVFQISLYPVWKILSCLCPLSCSIHSLPWVELFFIYNQILSLFLVEMCQFSFAFLDFNFSGASV